MRFEILIGQSKRLSDFFFASAEVALNNIAGLLLKGGKLYALQTILRGGRRIRSRVLRLQNGRFRHDVAF